MSIHTKIHLSERELKLVTDSEWILTKHVIIQKIYDLFGALLEDMKLENANLPILNNSILKNNGKISKGENYLGLPYIILDYPNYFTKENIYAIRTMFWWGNFFSSTLHVKGIFKNQISNSPDKFFSFLKSNDYSICINNNEWEHHSNENNYLRSEDLNKEKLDRILQKDFIKISKPLPLIEWDNGYDFLLQSYRRLREFRI